MSHGKSRARVAQNFVDRYGADGFQRLINAFSNGESGQAIADEFKVSRERVRQWKNTFGETITFYRLYPETVSLLGGAHHAGADHPGI